MKLSGGGEFWCSMFTSSVRLVENTNGHRSNVEVVVPCIHKAFTFYLTYPDHTGRLMAGLYVSGERRGVCSSVDLLAAPVLAYPAHTLIFLGFSGFAACFLPPACS
jgi:hypothetical protein